MASRKHHDLNNTSLTEDDEILTWAEVYETHRSYRGVYQRGEKLVSLLTDFGKINPCYPDRASADGERITYTGHGRRGDQGLSPENRALLNAIETKHAVPLFCKIAVGRWQHLGAWRVVEARHEYDEDERRMLWRLALQRATNEDEDALRE